MATERGARLDVARVSRSEARRSRIVCRSELVGDYCGAELAPSLVDLIGQPQSGVLSAGRRRRVGDPELRVVQAAAEGGPTNAPVVDAPLPPIVGTDAQRRAVAEL